jgi:hypothetical protein
VSLVVIFIVLALITGLWFTVYGGKRAPGPKQEIIPNPVEMQKAFNPHGVAPALPPPGAPAASAKPAARKAGEGPKKPSGAQEEHPTTPMRESPTR